MASEKAKSFVVRSSIVASLGGLLFGFDTAVISGAIDALERVFELNDWEKGFTVSSALFGTILGAATIQIPTNRYGRKPTLMMIALLYLISAIGSAFPWNWSSFLFFRFIGGVGVGGASVISPLYTAEIAPPKRRGFLVALTQFNIVFGILVAYVSNFIIAGFELGEAEWRWMFGVEAIPAFLFLVALIPNPESPRWLVTKGRFDEAKSLFLKLVGNEEAADAEFNTVKNAVAEERYAGREFLFCRRYSKLIFLAICIAMFNQLSGINAILYYAPKVFELAGASARMSMFFPTIIGFTNFVVTILALCVIDKFGRKKLMLVGSIGYISSLCLVGMLFAIFSDQFNAQMEKIDVAKAVEVVEESVSAPITTADGESLHAPMEKNIASFEQTGIGDSYPAEVASTTEVEADGIPKICVFGVLFGLMVFIASHGFGQGACIWVFLSEIFPNAVRAQGQALGCFTHWIMNAIVSGLFPPLLALLGPSMIFFGFTFFMCLQLLWVIFCMPETKQVPLEEMQKRLGITEK